MSITYLPAVLSDAQDLARCELEAFKEDAMYQATTGITSDSSQNVIDENLEYGRKRYERNIANRHIHWIKAVDTLTGTLAGFSGFEEPENRQSKDADNDKPPGKPSSWNAEFGKSVEARGREMRKRILGERKDFWYFTMLAVSPSCRSRGIAQQLISRSLERADEAGEDVYLESTPAAKRLYERSGFEAVAEIEELKGYNVPFMLRKSRNRN